MQCFAAVCVGNVELSVGGGIQSVVAVRACVGEVLYKVLGAVLMIVVSWPLH